MSQWLNVSLQLATKPRCSFLYWKWKRKILSVCVSFVEPTCHFGADLHVLQQYCQGLQIFCCPSSLHSCQLAVYLTETLMIQPTHKDVLLHMWHILIKLYKNVSVLLVFEISELFLQVRHFIQTLHSPSLTVLLIHFWSSRKYPTNKHP